MRKRSCLMHGYQLLALFLGVFPPLLLAEEGNSPPPALPKLWMKAPANIKQILISPNGKVIATQIDSFAFLYHRDSRKDLRTVEGCSGNLFAFTPNSKHLITQRAKKLKKGEQGWEVQLTDIATGKVVRSFELLPQHGRIHLLSVTAEKTLIVVGEDNQITSYDLTTGKPLGDFANKDYRPSVLALSADGKWLVTSGGTDRRLDNHELRVWDVQNRKLLHKLYEHTQRVTAIAISSDGKWCASVAGSRLWVFDRAKGSEKRRTDLLLYRPHTLLFTSDGKTLLALGEGAHHGLNSWDWQKSREIRGGIPRNLAQDFDLDNPRHIKKWNVGALLAGSLDDSGTLVTRGPKNELRLWFAPPRKQPASPIDPEPSLKPKPRK